MHVDEEAGCQSFSPFVFLAVLRQGLFVNQKFTILLRLDGQQSLSIILFSLLMLELQAHTAYAFFYVGA